MTVEDVIDFFGNAAKAARALGLNSNTVRMWKYRKLGVPILQQYKIEKITNGKLKIDSNLKGN